MQVCALEGRGIAVSAHHFVKARVRARRIENDVFTADDVVEQQPQRHTTPSRLHQRLTRRSLRNILGPGTTHGLDLHVADLGLEQRIRHVDGIYLINLFHDRGLVAVAQRLIELTAHVGGDILAQLLNAALGHAEGRAELFIEFRQ